MKREATFERFLEAVRSTNPFRSHRVTDPEGGDATVASIHKAAFDKLVRAAVKPSTAARRTSGSPSLDGSNGSRTRRGKAAASGG